MGAQHASTDTDSDGSAPLQMGHSRTVRYSALALLLASVLGVITSNAAIGDAAAPQPTVTPGHAALPAAADPAPDEQIRLTQDHLQRLQALADALTKKRSELTTLTSALAGISPEQDPEMHGQLATQACVAAANDEQWNIPFPQMMVHHRKVG